MEKDIKGVVIPIFDPQGKPLGYVMVNEKLEVSHSLQFGYKVGEKATEIEKLSREINELKRDIVYANNKYLSNLTKIKIISFLTFIFIAVSIIYGVLFATIIF